MKALSPKEHAKVGWLLRIGGGIAHAFSMPTGLGSLLREESAQFGRDIVARHCARAAVSLVARPEVRKCYRWSALAVFLERS